MWARDESSRMLRASSGFPACSSWYSSSRSGAKWVWIAALRVDVTIVISTIPESASSRMVCSITGLSPTGSISFGAAFVSGSSRVPSPATGITAFRIIHVPPCRDYVAANAIKPWQHRSSIIPRDPDFATKAARVLDLPGASEQGDHAGRGRGDGVALGPDTRGLSTRWPGSILRQRRTDRQRLRRVRARARLSRRRVAGLGGVYP